ncbi:hypothetical protein JHK84_051186 [Glycine max]|nr:hypothetical protein JHK85_052010 [Glycine max]KAG5095598.1 hypothetical protein JHK84_051186 [Glycine max]
MNSNGSTQLYIATVVETSNNNDGVHTTDVDILPNNVGGEPATDVDRKQNNDGSCEPDVEMDQNNDGGAPATDVDRKQNNDGSCEPDVEMDQNNDGLSNITIPHSVQALDHHRFSIVWLPPSPKWRNLRRVCATKVFSPQLLDSTQILRQQKVHDLLDFVKERCKKGEVIGFCERKMQKILVNVWAIGRDPTIWENPEMFMPERFLECEIDFKGHDFELIPFGTGKRICPGLPLAHRSMHLMVASLVHNFEWKLADGFEIFLNDPRHPHQSIINDIVFQQSA